MLAAVSPGWLPCCCLGNLHPHTFWDPDYFFPCWLAVGDAHQDHRHDQHLQLPVAVQVEPSHHASEHQTSIKKRVTQ